MARPASATWKGIRVGGKTGSAEMPRTRGGGYYEDRNINTFAAVFPSDAPRYVLVTTLYEPAETVGAGAAPHGGLDDGPDLRRTDPPCRAASGIAAGR
jgi:cell division protein FtsI/penicillin-binding protein 2